MSVASWSGMPDKANCFTKLFVDLQRNINLIIRRRQLSSAREFSYVCLECKQQLQGGRKGVIKHLKNRHSSLTSKLRSSNCDEALLGSKLKKIVMSVPFTQTKDGWMDEAIELSNMEQKEEAVFKCSREKIPASRENMAKIEKSSMQLPASTPHIRAVRASRVLSLLIELQSQVGDKRTFHCCECKKILTVPSEVAQHMVSDHQEFLQHMKKVFCWTKCANGVRKTLERAAEDGDFVLPDAIFQEISNESMKRKNEDQNDEELPANTPAAKKKRKSGIHLMRQKEWPMHLLEGENRFKEQQERHDHLTSRIPGKQLRRTITAYTAFLEKVAKGDVGGVCDLDVMEMIQTIELNPQGVDAGTNGSEAESKTKKILFLIDLLSLLYEKAVRYYEVPDNSELIKSKSDCKAFRFGIAMVTVSQAKLIFFYGIMSIRVFEETTVNRLVNWIRPNWDSVEDPDPSLGHKWKKVQDSRLIVGAYVYNMDFRKIVENCESFFLDSVVAATPAFRERFGYMVNLFLFRGKFNKSVGNVLAEMPPKSPRNPEEDKKSSTAQILSEDDDEVEDIILGDGITDLAEATLKQPQCKSEQRKEENEAGKSSTGVTDDAKVDGVGTVQSPKVSKEANGDEDNGMEVDDIKEDENDAVAKDVSPSSSEKPAEEVSAMPDHSNGSQSSDMEKDGDGGSKDVSSSSPVKSTEEKSEGTVPDNPDASQTSIIEKEGDKATDNESGESEANIVEKIDDLEGIEGQENGIKDPVPGKEVKEELTAEKVEQTETSDLPSNVSESKEQVCDKSEDAPCQESSSKSNVEDDLVKESSGTDEKALEEPKEADSSPKESQVEETKDEEKEVRASLPSDEKSGSSSVVLEELEDDSTDASKGDVEAASTRPVRGARGRRGRASGNTSNQGSRKAATNTDEEDSGTKNDASNDKESGIGSAEVNEKTEEKAEEFSDPPQGDADATLKRPARGARGRRGRAIRSGNVTNRSDNENTSNTDQEEGTESEAGADKDATADTTEVIEEAVTQSADDESKESSQMKNEANGKDSEDAEAASVAATTVL